MRVERVAVPGREVGHRVGVRVALVLEEDREVGLDDIPQDRHRQSLVSRLVPRDGTVGCQDLRTRRCQILVRPGMIFWHR